MYINYMNNLFSFPLCDLYVLKHRRATKSLYGDLSRAGPCMGAPIVEICSILKHSEAYMCRRIEDSPSLCMETSLGPAPVWGHPLSRCDKNVINLNLFCVSSLCMETSLGLAPVWGHPLSRYDKNGHQHLLCFIFYLSRVISLRIKGLFILFQIFFLQFCTGSYFGTIISEYHIYVCLETRNYPILAPGAPRSASYPEIWGCVSRIVWESFLLIKYNQCTPKVLLEWLYYPTFYLG